MAAPAAHGPPPERRRRKKPHWWEGFAPPMNPEDRARLIADPGPTWAEYFQRDFLRWMAVLFFLIMDVFVTVPFYHPFVPEALFPILVGALYLEFLLYEYLWRRPNLEKESKRGPFVRTWYRPVRYGIWTEEYREWTAGHDPAAPAGPDPNDFL